MAEKTDEAGKLVLQQETSGCDFEALSGARAFRVNFALRISAVTRQGFAVLAVCPSCAKLSARHVQAGFAAS